MSPGGALDLCRFLHDSAAMLLWGGFAFLAWLVPQALAEDVAQRLRPLRNVAVALAVLTLLAALPLRAAMLGEGWGDAMDLETLRAVLFETSIGGSWQIQAVCALLLLGVLFVPPRWRRVAIAVASGLLLASLATIGHTALHQGSVRIAHMLNDAVHVLCAGGWLGALIPLLPVLHALDDPAWRAEAGCALRNFSRVGHGIVALVLVSGVANTLLVLGRLPTDFASPYQALLAAKIVLVGAMVCLALGNRYVLVPRLSRSGGAEAALRMGIFAEIALGLVVIGLVAVFGMLEPV